LGARFNTVRIPAEDILHVYRQDRPGQIRGITWFAPSMLRLKDFDEYEDAQLVRQKIAACFAVFIKDIDGVDTNQTTEQKDRFQKVEPGMIHELAGGQDITTATPPVVEFYDVYTRTVLHGIASGLGITYEALTGDLSQVNFSSARMGFLQMNRNIKKWRKKVIIDQFMSPAFSWWVNAMTVLGADTTRVRPVFTPQKREMVDPQKENAAQKDAVRSGFDSLSDTIRNNGKDPEDHFEEMKSDKEKLAEMGIILDTDPSQDPKRLAALRPQAGSGSSDE